MSFFYGYEMHTANRQHQQNASMSNILGYLKKPSTYVIAAVVVVLVLAYRRFIPAQVAAVATKLPGATA